MTSFSINTAFTLQLCTIAVLFAMTIFIYMKNKHSSSNIVLDSLLVNLIKHDDSGCGIKWMYIVKTDETLYV